MAEQWKQVEEYDRVHAERFRLSREWLNPILRGWMEILECGDAGTFSRNLERDWGLSITNTTGDLRYGAAFEMREDPFDGVLLMEVLEHIHDQEALTPTEWRATGTTALLRSIFGVLKPGGFLFLTTPNACSNNVLAKVLTMQPPMVYRPHVREYSPSEVDAMLREAGFRIERFETLDPWGGGVSAAGRRLIEGLTRDHSHHSPHRGENIFVLARRPA